MSILKSEHPKHDQQEKNCRNSHINFDLNVTAQESDQEPDLQCDLIENNYGQYSEFSEKAEKHVDNHSMETDKHEEQLPQGKVFEGCADHLLILAQSAAILATQSEDSVANKTHAKNQNQDQEGSLELLGGLSSVSHANSESCELCDEVTGTRLTQIRKQARCKYLTADRDMAKVYQRKHLQRKIIRLSQIKQQARCKDATEQRQGRILRLSQMKHQARSKNNVTVKELPETYGCTEGLEANFGANKLQCKSLQQHIPNRLPVQNNVLCFTGLPNDAFQQCDQNMRWMLYMHHIQLKEHHCIIARQHRAKRIKEIRALKYKQQNSKIDVLANSDAQKEILPVKRFRLTQLRRKVRLGNQCSVMQESGEN